MSGLRVSFFCKYGAGHMEIEGKTECSVGGTLEGLLVWGSGPQSVKP